MTYTGGLEIGAQMNNLSYVGNIPLLSHVFLLNEWNFFTTCIKNRNNFPKRKEQKQHLQFFFWNYLVNE